MLSMALQVIPGLLFYKIGTKFLIRWGYLELVGKT